MARRRDAVVRRGLRHVGRAIVEQPGMFTLAVLASSLYGAHDRGQRLGHRRDHRPRAAARVRRRRHHRGGPVARASAAIIGVALLKIVGILGRRLFAGIMSYRLQADYRRRVTRPVPAPAAVLAPAAPHRPAAVQRELRRRGRPGSSSRRCRSPAARW